MRSWIIFAGIIGLALVMSGCSQQQTSSASFIGGNVGLSESFLDGSPPPTITDNGGTPFSIAVKLSNVGESDVNATDGYAEVWGLDPGTYNSNLAGFRKYFKDQTGFSTTIRGAVKNYDGSVLNGGVSTIDFGTLKYLPTIPGSMPQKVWVNICYDYTTKVAAQLCINNNVNQAIGTSNNVCILEGEKNPQNSGAPIHVTSLKESYAGNNKIGLTLVLSHVGSGDAFFAPDKLDCTNDPSNLNEGKVRVDFKSIQINGKSVPVDCTGLDDNNEVRLYSDKSGKETATLYCTIDTTGITTVVQVPVQLSMDYVYLDHISTDMTIRHVGS